MVQSSFADEVLASLCVSADVQRTALGSGDAYTTSGAETRAAVQAHRSEDEHPVCRPETNLLAAQFSVRMATAVTLHGSLRLPTAFE